MRFEMLGLDVVLDPWAAQTTDSDRVVAVQLWLMALREDPFGVVGAERLPHELSLFTGEEWGSL